MPLVITPEANIPLPFDVEPDEIPQFRDRAKAAVNTVRVLAEAGAPIEVTEEDRFESHKLFAEEKPLNIAKTSPGAIVHLDALLSEYDKGLLNASHRLRNYVTNRLIEESNNADPKIKIKALELLGKVGEVGLFTERVEVTHTIRSSAEIEQELMNRLEKYMGDVEVVQDSRQDRVKSLEEELKHVGEVSVADGEDEIPQEPAVTDPYVPPKEVNLNDIKL